MEESILFLGLHMHGNGKPVLVNVKNICYITGGEKGTAIGFNGSDDNYVVVNESVDDIKNILRKVEE